MTLMTQKTGKNIFALIKYFDPFNFHTTFNYK